MTRIGRLLRTVRRVERERRARDFRVCWCRRLKWTEEYFRSEEGERRLFGAILKWIYKPEVVARLYDSHPIFARLPKFDRFYGAP